MLPSLNGVKKRNRPDPTAALDRHWVWPTLGSQSAGTQFLRRVSGCRISHQTPTTPAVRGRIVPRNMSASVGSLDLRPPSVPEIPLDRFSRASRSPTPIRHSGQPRSPVMSGSQKMSTSVGSADRQTPSVPEIPSDRSSQSSRSPMPSFSASRAPYYSASVLLSKAKDARRKLEARSDDLANLIAQRREQTREGAAWLAFLREEKQRLTQRTSLLAVQAVRVRQIRNWLRMTNFDKQRRNGGDVEASRDQDLSDEEAAKRRSGPQPVAESEFKNFSTQTSLPCHEHELTLSTSLSDYVCAQCMQLYEGGGSAVGGGGEDTDAAFRAGAFYHCYDFDCDYDICLECFKTLKEKQEKKLGRSLGPPQIRLVASPSESLGQSVSTPHSTSSSSSSLTPNPSPTPPLMAEKHTLGKSAPLPGAATQSMPPNDVRSAAARALSLLITALRRAESGAANAGKFTDLLERATALDRDGVLARWGTG